MTVAPEAFPYVAGAAGAAAVLFALALNRRSWPLWLLALSLLVVALGVSYAFRGELR